MGERGYIHNVIDHAEKYADGQVHANGLENFWSLLKHALRGTYISVEPFHLFRYLDEQAFRFNTRRDMEGCGPLQRSRAEYRGTPPDLQGTYRSTRPGPSVVDTLPRGPKRKRR
jgi:hypothetical protein